MWKKRVRAGSEVPEWLIDLMDRKRRADRRVAEWLQLKAVATPVRVIRTVLMVYLLLSAIIFTAVIWNGDHLSKPADIQRVTLPAFAHTTPKWVEPGFSFHHFMDSALQELTVSARLDSLRRARPGFADTLRRLEEIYK